MSGIFNYQVPSRRCQQNTVNTQDVKQTTTFTTQQPTNPHSRFHGAFQGGWNHAQSHVQGKMSSVCQNLAGGIHGQYSNFAAHNQSQSALEHVSQHATYAAHGKAQTAHQHAGAHHAHSSHDIGKGSTELPSSMLYTMAVGEDGTQYPVDLMAEGNLGTLTDLADASGASDASVTVGTDGAQPIDIANDLSSMMTSFAIGEEDGGISYSTGVVSNGEAPTLTTVLDQGLTSVKV